MLAPIAEEKFLELVRTFRSSAFRFEARDSYALGYERVDFGQFLAGSPTPPPQLDWWRPWLDRVTQWRQEGKTVARVRVLADPPTDYQRWMLWSDRWAGEAGEDIRYIPRRKAEQIGLVRGYDWWLLDDLRVIVMRFTEDGEIDRKELTEDPGTVIRFRAWRDLAVRNATPAEQIAAA
jgi:hypothetical protein